MDERAVVGAAREDARQGGSGAGGSCWRAVAVPVALAVVLSVAATLLLGGVLRPAGAGPSWLGANGPGRACCLPGEPAGGPR